MQAKPGGKNIRVSNAKIYSMTRFIGRHIAYAAVQVCISISFVSRIVFVRWLCIQAMFLLSTVEAWVADDGAFSLQEFFNEVLGPFEDDPEYPWVVSTLAWYDQ